MPVSQVALDAIRAAQYLRKSTEHQQYSLDNQRDAIRAFAEKKGIAIVATFEDSGRSGLDLSGRPGLKHLLATIEAGRNDFEILLVYDVSRWGRFQNIDESAAYEFRCFQKGVRVVYCAEPFLDDGSIAADLLKAIKRTIAAEQSRALSTKVFEGQSRLIRLGYRQGGVAGFGLRRSLIDSQGQLRMPLEVNERKAIQTDRVVLTPGPTSEVELVNWIFQTFVEDDVGESEIARRLNERGIGNAVGSKWTRSSIHRMLINEKYAGHNVWNRVSWKLRGRYVYNPPELQIRKWNAFPAIVSKELFGRAAAKLEGRMRRPSDDELLQRLASLRNQQGRLTAALIDACLPNSAWMYKRRFGGLLAAYERIGYRTEPNNRRGVVRSRSAKLRISVTDGLRDACLSVGIGVCAEGDDLRLGELATIGVLIASRRPASRLTSSWTCRIPKSICADLLLIAFADPAASKVTGYAIGLSDDFKAGKVVLHTPAASASASLFPTTLEEVASLFA
jgi:DNA invertase Pin-like site-specific DNA recombinase